MTSFFSAFQEDVNICPVATLRAYEDRTSQFRNDDSDVFKSKLFLSWIGKHEPVSGSTIARRLKTCMLEAGIDINIFKPHSVRGATCSKAAGVGVTTEDILDAADWSSEGTFQCFYNRQNKDLVQQFCHHLILQNLHADIRWSLPKCNLRMAQGTQCLHAIGNYMRKVTLNYQHVSPTPLSYVLILYLFSFYRCI